MDNGDGNLDAIGCRCENALHLIARAVIPSGYFFLLEQGGAAARHVVFEHRLRSDERLVAITELGRIVFTIEVGIVDISRLRKFEAAGLSALQAGHANLRQALLPFVRDVIVFEEVRIIEHDIRAMRHNLLPILAAGIGDRGFDQTEIASCIVHADMKEIAIVVRVVLNVLFARFHEFPFRHGLIGGNVARFAGGVTAGNEQ